MRSTRQTKNVTISDSSSDCLAPCRLSVLHGTGGSCGSMPAGMHRGPGPLMRCCSNSPKEARVGNGAPLLKHFYYTSPMGKVKGKIV